MKKQLFQPGFSYKYWLSTLAQRQAISILLLWSYFIPAGFGQTKQWDKTFGGSKIDYFIAIQQTSDGGYILGGWSNSPISGDKTEDNRDSIDYNFAIGDYWIVKLNAAGQKEWDKTFGGDSEDYLSYVQQTSDGGYILGGTSNSEKSGDKSDAKNGDCYIPGGCTTDYWVVKLDAAGNKVWDKTIGASENENLTSIQQTPDGGYILGGSSTSEKNGDKSEGNKGYCYVNDYDQLICPADYWIVKLDADGNQQWDKTIGGNDEDSLRSVQLTRDGGYILGGSSKSPVSGDKSEGLRGPTDYWNTTFDYWVVKLNPEGQKEWDRTFGGTDNDFFSDLRQTTDGGYFLGGSSWSGISGDKSEANKGGCNDYGCRDDYWVVKLNAAGQKQWDKTYGGSDLDRLYSLQQTSDGGYILGGTSYSEISGDKTEGSKGWNDYWVVKLNAAGGKEWDKTFGGNGGDQLSSLSRPDRGYILGGLSNSNISGDKTEDNKGSADYWVVKINDENSICHQAITSYSLVNADTHQVIRPLHDGDVIDLSTLPTVNIKISARTNPVNVGSVVFHLDGQQVAIENIKPYRYGGAGKFTCGFHSLTATPYCASKGEGFAGQSLTLHFQVTEGMTASSQENHLSELLASPNPFTGQTIITFSVPKPGMTTLEVYDGQGTLVERLYQDQAEPGKIYTVSFQPGARPNGLYFTRLTTSNRRQYLKLLLTQ